LPLWTMGVVAARQPATTTPTTTMSRWCCRRARRCRCHRAACPCRDGRGAARLRSHAWRVAAHQPPVSPSSTRVTPPRRVAHTSSPPLPRPPSHRQQSPLPPPPLCHRRRTVAEAAQIRAVEACVRGRAFVPCAGGLRPRHVAVRSPGGRRWTRTRPATSPVRGGRRDGGHGVGAPARQARAAARAKVDAAWHAAARHRKDVGALFVAVAARPKVGLLSSLFRCHSCWLCRVAVQDASSPSKSRSGETPCSPNLGDTLRAVLLRGAVPVDVVL
jgi:hypothetical protein